MRVTVVGAGVIGLTSAMRLAEAGHQVRVVAAGPPEQTTSAVAAAVWYPYRAFPEQLVTGWSARSYHHLARLATVPGTGVRMRWGRELRRTPAADPWWRSAVPEFTRLDGDDLPAGYRDGWRMRVPVVDMSRHLPWLRQRLVDLGVPLTLRRLDTLADADPADVVVNCTGLGARELVGDGQLTPVRGQVLVVEQFGLTEWVLDDSDEARPTYVIPREETVILGGTAEEGAEDLTPRPEVAEEIRRRCAALVPAAADARVLAHRVGLRPARPTVRLERDATADRPVVHCYGHGGAGVTLSYGCAEEVVALVASLADTAGPQR